MAIYHCSAKVSVSRGAGRTATGAVAYRAGIQIVDERTGLVFDYTRKQGVEHSVLCLPGGGTADRSAFWNQVELHHKRGDAIVARELEIALPAELSADQRRALADGYARELSDRYGVATDLSLHAPRTVTDRMLEINPDQHWEIDPVTGRRHNGNWHAHILFSGCRVSPAGELGRKAEELDPIHCKRRGLSTMVDRERERWTNLANAALEKAGYAARIDHRSLEAQGIDREPQQHLGPALSGMVRRGKSAFVIEARQREAAERLERAAELGALERIEDKLDQSILDLTGELERAIAEAHEQATHQEQPKPEPLPEPRPEPKPAVLVRDVAGEEARARAHNFAQAAAERMRAEMKAKEQAHEAAAELARQRAAAEAKTKEQAGRPTISAKEWKQAAQAARDEIERARDVPKPRGRDRDSGPEFGM